MARVHTYRFHDEIALSVTGTGGETVYLSAANALTLAKTLRALATKPGAGGADLAARKHGEPRRA
jgi:hypothetical protein